MRILLCILALSLASGCSKTVELTSPFGRDVTTAPGNGPAPSADSEKRETPTITGRIRLLKEGLFSREFLWGADLQFSSEYDAEYELYNQALALGHVPARFVRVGNALHLLADQRRLYPGNANHPEERIARFEILAEDAETFTVAPAESALFLARWLRDPKEGKVRQSWVRSLEFVDAETLLLQESTVQTDDGQVFEFMESLWPAERMRAGKDFEKIEVDPGSLSGIEEGPHARFRYLWGEKIHQGERVLAFAQHYDLSEDSATIDWYASRNTPAEMLEPVRLGVEGWNRYFRGFKGIARDVLRFRGMLPEGIKIGDPRYNVIVWDSRTVAGAAYETQASDPLTGKQSHSLIYLPAAWLQIGKDYWEEGRPSSSAGPRPRPAHVRCAKDLSDLSDFLRSGAIADAEVETFAIDLLKQTLFHEVGHALGLAHNFKASLLYDPARGERRFATSIMDYNDYELERAAFDSTRSANGPILEYDRQALSMLYNGGRDLAADTEELPACNDEEADSEDGGIDPLCLRYDFGKDPTVSIQTAWDRVRLREIPGDVTLSAALARVKDAHSAEPALNAVVDTKTLTAWSRTWRERALGAARFYLVSGKRSLGRTIRVNLGSLKAFLPEILPEGTAEAGLRERAMAGVRLALETRALPEEASAAVTSSRDALLTAFHRTPLAAKLDRSALKAAEAALREAWDSAWEDFELDAEKGLARIATAVLSELTLPKKAPLFLGELSGKRRDFEREVTKLLADSVADFTRPAAQRLAAARSAVTYGERLDFMTTLEKLRKQLQREIETSRTHEEREELYQILAALK